MMYKSQNSPQLRFKGFVGEWKASKLGEMAQFKAGYAFKSEQMLSKKSNYQLLKMSNVYQNELRLDRNPSFWNTIDSKQKEFLLKKGDSILTLTGTVGKKDYGYSIKIEDDNKFLLNQRLVLLREIQNKSDNIFISYLISNERFLFYFFAEAKGGTGNQTNVSTEDVKNIKLNFPTLPEQQKIASFLSAVDEKIQQLSRKKELLEQYKKGVMQQLFSGKLRFKDENGNDYADWEEKKLGDVCEIVGGGTPDTNIPEYWGGEIQWFTPTEIKSDFVSNSIRTITELGLQKSSAKKLPIGTILLTTRATIGEVSIAREECSTNQGFQSLIARKGNSNIFIFNWIKQNKNELTSRANGSTFPEISKTAIEKIFLNAPSFPEQQKIANFLSSIDVKIESTNQQIKQTQSFKKGLLQQLFV